MSRMKRRKLQRCEQQIGMVYQYVRCSARLNVRDNLAFRSKS